MPKVKTSRAAAKRFKTTGTGKLVRNKAYKSHLLTKKSQKSKRNLRKSTVVDATNVKNMKKILPYMETCAAGRDGTLIKEENKKWQELKAV